MIRNLDLGPLNHFPHQRSSHNGELQQKRARNLSISFASVFPLYNTLKHPNTNTNVKSVLNSSRAVPALTEKATPAHTSSTDIPHRSAFYLSPQLKSSKYKAKPRRLSPCVTDWRQRVARWSIYFQLTGASTIQYSWHKWYWRKHYTARLAQVVLAPALYIYRPAGTSGTSYRRRLLAPPCRPDFPRRRAPEQLS